VSSSIARFFARPGRFVLFQALRTIDWAYGRPERQRWVHVRHKAYLHHAACDIADTETEESPPRLDSTVFGLLGPNGPMPLRLTEEAVWQSGEKGSPLADFFSMLGERQVLALYDAWRTSRPEEALRRDGNSVYRRIYGALSGVAFSSASDRAWIAQFVGYPRGEQGLESAVILLTGLPASVQQFVGEWLGIPPPDRACLGRVHLGAGVTIGSRVWQRSTRFAIKVEVRTTADYLSLLPRRGERAVAIDRLMARYLRFGLTWALWVQLPADQAIEVQLGKSGTLGETAWLGRPHTRTATVRFRASAR
jgi:type VI secretion system protein ImpH